jgi:hypothetical protein
MEEKNPLELKAYPFAVVGFFVSEKEPSEILNMEIETEKLEELQRLIQEIFFKNKEDVDVSILPSIVPPDRVNEALEELAKVIFSPEEEE